MYYIYFRTGKNDSFHTLEPICLAMGQSIYQCWYLNPWTVILILFLVMLIFREMLEFYTLGLKYFKSKENYLQVFILILSGTFVCWAPFNLEGGTHIAGWAIFLTWVNITTLLGRIEFIGKYIFMSIDVTKTLLKTLLIFTPSFIAFTLTFNIFLKADHEFYGLTTSALKVFVMMIGELQFTETFIHSKVKEKGGRNFSVQVHIYDHKFLSFSN